MSRHVWTLAVIVWFLSVTTAEAQVSRAADPLFQSHDIVEVQLVAPLSTIMSKRTTEDEYDGQFRYLDASGETFDFDVAVRTRGNFRLRKRVCPFAPLRLNFKKSQTDGTLLEKQDKLKLVTHCRNDSQRYQESVIREYLAYRMLNQITDMSFRARLVKITYEDTDSGNAERRSYGILIEHDDRLAKRFGFQTIEVGRITIGGLQPAHMNLMSVFHYLIGNTDFSPVAGPDATCCHNHVLIGADNDRAYSVPYDFDQAGLVDAPYAAPNRRFRLSSVRQRLYRGRCSNNEYLDETIATFQQVRDALYSLIGEQEGLSNLARKKLTRYVNSFYKTIDSPARVERQLVRKCI